MKNLKTFGMFALGVFAGYALVQYLPRLHAKKTADQSGEKMNLAGRPKERPKNAEKLYDRSTHRWGWFYPDPEDETNLLFWGWA